MVVQRIFIAVEGFVQVGGGVVEAFGERLKPGAVRARLIERPVVGLGKRIAGYLSWFVGSRFIGGSNIISDGSAERLFGGRGGGRVLLFLSVAEELPEGAIAGPWSRGRRLHGSTAAGRGSWIRLGSDRFVKARWWGGYAFDYALLARFIGLRRGGRVQDLRLRLDALCWLHRLRGLRLCGRAGL